MSDVKAIELSENNEFGWQLLHHALKTDITENHHLVIVVIHWLLIRNKFRCLGIGDKEDTAKLNNDDDSGELLPDGWNSNDFPIMLRYNHKDTIYVITLLMTEGQLIVNLYGKKGTVNTEVSNILINPANTIKSLTGNTLVQLLNEPEAFLSRIRTELIRPVFDGNRKDGGTQTIETQTKKTPNIHETPSVVVIPNRHSNRRDLIDEDEDFLFRPYNPLGNIGSRDLNPLGIDGQGSGMIGTLPNRFNRRGPGGRYDPTNPFDIGMRRDPDFDHMRPPNSDYNF